MWVVILLTSPPTQRYFTGAAERVTENCDIMSRVGTTTVQRIDATTLVYAELREYAEA